jgi:hypothetical protein
MTRELSHKAGAALLKKAFSNKNASLSHTEALNLLAQLKGYEAWSHLQKAAKSNSPKATAAKTRKPAKKLLTLSQALQDHYGVWGEFSAFPRRDWEYEVENHDTNLGYWDWVVSTLEARDLLCCATEFTPMPTAEVTLPDGTTTRWWLENNLTDRWGSFNEHAADRKSGLAILQLDEALALEERLLERLREQMYDETTFIARKDGKFGLLYEVEYCSRESEAELCKDDPKELEQYKPHEVVVAALLKGLRTVQETFPSVEMGIPDSDEIIWNRPAVWAFVPLDTLNEEQRSKLGIMLMTL